MEYITEKENLTISIFLLYIHILLYLERVFEKIRGI